MQSHASKKQIHNAFTKQNKKFKVETEIKKAQNAVIAQTQFKKKHKISHWTRSYVVKVNNTRLFVQFVIFIQHMHKHLFFRTC